MNPTVPEDQKRKYNNTKSMNGEKVVKLKNFNAECLVNVLEFIMGIMYEYTNLPFGAGHHFASFGDSYDTNQ